VAGYARTPVAPVLKRAGISRQTFYELYEDKQAAFLDALEVVGAVLVGELQTAFVGEGTPRARARAAVDRYLTALADHLPFARLFLVEVHAAGPVAMERRAAVQDRLVDQLVAATGARRSRDRFACRAYVAAVASLVALPVATGDVEARRALRRPLLAHLDALFDGVAGPDQG
jgi:AcrR family transcriptional regulator